MKLKLKELLLQHPTIRTASQLATALDTKYPVVYRWVSGRRFPDEKNLDRLIKVLGCTVSELLEPEDPVD